MSIDPSTRPGTVEARVRAAAPQPRPVPPAPGDRIRRQVEAIDAWNAARREREAALVSLDSREDRLVAHRDLDVLRRTQLALAARTADELSRDAPPMPAVSPTAVIAHRHPWFADRLSALLEAAGVTVLERTDNGADALGAVIAGQPDVVVTGDRLTMTSGRTLLEECRRFAPQTWRAVQASGQSDAAPWTELADAVFLRLHPPAAVADALTGLLTASGALPSGTAPAVDAQTSPGPTWPAAGIRAVRPLDADSDEPLLMCDTCGAHESFSRDLPVVSQVRAFARGHRHDGAPCSGPGLS